MVLEKIEDLSSIDPGSVSVDPVSLPQISLGIPDWVSWWGNTALFWGKVVLVPIGLAALGYGAVRGFKYCVSHNYGFAQPPPGYGMVVYRSLSYKDTERPKRHYGRPVTETIIVDDKERMVEVRETVRILKGKLIAEIINLNGYVVYSESGDICPENHYHDPVSGLDIPIGEKINPDYQNETGGNAAASAAGDAGTPVREKQKLFVVDDDKERVGRLWEAHTRAKEGGNTVNRWFRRNLNVTWIGQVPNILDVVPELDVIWEERKDIKKPAAVRRERQDMNRITQVDQAIDVMDPPAIERGGYPWKFQLLVFWRQANLRKSWVEIPDSADQASAMILDAFLSFIQGVFILRYEGINANGTGGETAPKSPGELKKKKCLFSMDNKLISEEFFKYLRRHGKLHYIREVLGREIKEGGIVIQNKTLAPPYDDLITEQRTAEIRLNVAELEAQADFVRQHKRAEGANEILDAFESHERVGPVFAATGTLPLVEGSKDRSPAPKKEATERLVDLTSANVANQMFGQGSGGKKSKKETGGGPQDQGRRKWRKGGKRAQKSEDQNSEDQNRTQ